jgi:L-threonylcarbamoyladenylate synthase
MYPSSYKVQQLPIMALISSCTASTLKDAAASLRSGNLVAFPTETVYGLGVDATNKDAVAHLYQVKGRPSDHPLIVHISSIANLDKWAREIPEYAIKLARAFWPGPMTLILPRTNLAMDFITGNQDCVGIRVPSHPLATALLTEYEEQGGLGVAAPSANRFGKVSPTTVDAVVEELSGYLAPSDLILNGGKCEVGVESTIINCIQDIPKILRPGAITAKMISDLVGLQVNQITTVSNKLTIKAPGLLQSHYAPKSKVFLSATPNFGDGFIALSDIQTPPGAIRLASPKNNQEYAQLLYQALRLADNKQLPNVIVIPPTGDYLAIAICDRLEKCAYKS